MFSYCVPQFAPPGTLRANFEPSQPASLQDFPSILSLSFIGVQFITYHLGIYSAFWSEDSQMKTVNFEEGGEKVGSQGGC